MGSGSSTQQAACHCGTCHPPSATPSAPTRGLSRVTPPAKSAVLGGALGAAGKGYIVYVRAPHQSCCFRPAPHQPPRDRPHGTCPDCLSSADPAPARLELCRIEISPLPPPPTHQGQPSFGEVDSTPVWGCEVSRRATGDAAAGCVLDPICPIPPNTRLVGSSL